MNNITEDLNKIKEERKKAQEDFNKILDELDEKERQIRFEGVPNYVGKYFKITYGDLCLTSYFYVTDQKLNSATDCVVLKGYGIDEVLTMKFSSLSIKSPRQHDININNLKKLVEISKDEFAIKVNRLIKNFRSSFVRLTNIELYDQNR